jgi:Tfp pilus assembly protein PilN
MSQVTDETVMMPSTETPLLPLEVRLPRVNLLPPEIIEQRSVRRAQLGLGAAVVASVLVVGGLWGVAAAQEASAQRDLDGAVARQTALNSEVAKLEDVAATYREIQQGRTVLSAAMSTEVRWSRYLNDLSLLVPDNVWLTDMTVTPVTGAAAGSTGSATFGPQAAPGAIATISFGGVARQQEDVANWLQSISRGKGFTNVYFSDSTLQRLEGDVEAVKFTSTVTVTAEALSDRYPLTTGD